MGMAMPESGSPGSVRTCHSAEGIRILPETGQRGKGTRPGVRALQPAEKGESPHGTRDGYCRKDHSRAPYETLVPRVRTLTYSPSPGATGHIFNHLPVPFMT